MEGVEGKTKRKKKGILILGKHKTRFIISAKENKLTREFLIKVRMEE